MGTRPKQTFFQRKYTNGLQAHEKMLNITNHQGNANQNHNEISPHNLSKWLSTKSLQITNTGENVEKRELLYTIGRNVNWCIHYGKHYEGSSKN